MPDIKGFLGMLKFMLIGPFPDGSLGGVALNFSLTGIGMAIGFVLGLFIALGRLAKQKYISYPCLVLVELTRATPLILIIFWFYFFIPNVLGQSVSIFFSAAVSISAYSAVYQSEIFRGGFQSISHGQLEAALSTGLKYYQVIFFIYIPQTIKIMLPSFVSFFISLFKDTSVTYIIGIIELTQTSVIISQRVPERLITAYASAGIIYFVFCYIMSQYSKKIERNMERYKY